jgi:hypothetical protein
MPVKLNLIQTLRIAASDAWVLHYEGGRRHLSVHISSHLARRQYAQINNGIRRFVHVNTLFNKSLLRNWILGSDTLHWPPLWSGWSEFLATDPEVRDRYRRYQIFWEVVGLERSLLSLVSTIEELLETKSSCSGLENRDHGCRDLRLWSRGTLYLQKLALTSRTSGGRSVCIVR